MGDIPCLNMISPVDSSEGDRGRDTSHCMVLVIGIIRRKWKAPLPKEVVKGAPSSILVDRQESIGDGSVNVIYDWSVRTESSNHNLVDKTC